MGSSSPSGGSSGRQLTKQELDLIREQTSALQDSRALIQQAVSQQNLSQPLIFGALGFDIQQDANGAITGVTPRAGGLFDQMTSGQGFGQAEQLGPATQLAGFNPTDPRNVGGPRLRTLQAEAFDRAIAAERNPQSNPALEQSIADERAQYQNQLVAQYGADYLGSTGGQQAMSQFDARASAARAASNREDIGFFSQLGSGLLNQLTGMQQQTFGRELATFGANQQTALAQQQLNNQQPFLQQQLNQATFNNQLAQQTAPFAMAMQASGALGQAIGGPAQFFGATQGLAAGYSGPLQGLIQGRNVTSNYAGPSPGAQFGSLAGTALGAGLGFATGTGPVGAMAGAGIGASVGGLFGGLF